MASSIVRLKCPSIRLCLWALRRSTNSTAGREVPPNRSLRGHEPRDWRQPPTGLRGGRGRSQHDAGPVQTAQHGRRVPGLISGSGILLLVARVVFLIHHDQAKVVERQEHRTARTDEQTTLAALLGHPAEGGGPLARSEPAVVHLQPVPEKPAQADDELGGQCDLRNEKQRVPPLGERVVNQVGVDFGLARSRDPLQARPVPCRPCPPGWPPLRGTAPDSGRRAADLPLPPPHPGVCLKANTTPLSTSRLKTCASRPRFFTSSATGTPDRFLGSSRSGHHRPRLGRRPCIHVVQLLSQPSFIRCRAFGDPHHGHHLSAGATAHFLVGQDPARFHQRPQHGCGVLDAEQFAHLLEGHGAPEPQGLHDLKFPVLQTGVVPFLRVGGRLQLGLTREAHSGRKGREGDLAR